MKKTLLILIVLTIAGLIGWQIYQKSSSQDQMPNRQTRNVAVAVETRPVSERMIRDVGLFTGTLSPSSQFIVAPKISGRLERILVNIGDLVKHKQLIAVMDDDEYIQQVDQARAELEVAKANLEESRSALDIAGRELERAKALRKKKIASESELDSAKAQFRTHDAKHKVALAQLAHKKAALKAARIRLSYTQIYVSRKKGDGQWVVGERFVDEGAMLPPNASIVSVLDIGSLIAVIHVIEKDYSKVRIGQQAIMTTDAFPGRTFTGKILRLAPLLKETSREARVEIEVPNREGLLKPGMFVRVEIEFGRRNGATVIPLNALVKRNGRQGVFLADTQGMKASFVPVTLGIINGNLAEVVSPPLSGAVVTLGQHLLEDGSAIILPDKGPPARPSTGKTDGKGSEERRGPPSGGRP